MQPTDNARLWLVRHGETDYNVAGRIQGQIPTELNANGHAQAAKLARYFAPKPFAAVWSSDLPRARQTAEAIAAPLKLPVNTTTDFRERNFGQFEGKTTDEIHLIKKSMGLTSTGDLAEWSGVPGIESDEELWGRFANTMKKLSTDYRGKDVLIITHGGAIKLALYKILGIPTGQPRRFPLSNGILAITQFRNDAFYLLSMVDLPLLFDHETSADTATSKPKLST